MVRRILRWIAWVVLALVAVLASALLFMSLVSVNLDLSGERKVFESAAELIVARPVKIGEQIKLTLTTSLWPALEVESVRIGNPPGFGSDTFLSMQHAKLHLGMLPLLRGKLHIRGFSISGLDIKLAENSEGRVNWTFLSERSDGPEPPESQWQSLEPGAFEFASDALVIESLELEDVSVEYLNPGLKSPVRLLVKRGSGAGSAWQSFSLAMPVF